MWAKVIQSETYFGGAAAPVGPQRQPGASRGTDGTGRGALALSAPVNEDARGGFSPALASSALQTAAGGRFAAQAKQIWGLTLITADAHSIFSTKGAFFPVVLLWALKSLPRSKIETAPFLIAVTWGWSWLNSAVLCG